MVQDGPVYNQYDKIAPTPAEFGGSMSWYGRSRVPKELGSLRPASLWVGEHGRRRRYFPPGPWPGPNIGGPDQVLAR